MVVSPDACSDCVDFVTVTFLPCRLTSLLCAPRGGFAQVTRGACAASIRPPNDRPQAAPSRVAPKPSSGRVSRNDVFRNNMFFLAKNTSFRSKKIRVLYSKSAVKETIRNPESNSILVLIHSICAVNLTAPPRPRRRILPPRRTNPSERSWPFSISSRRQSRQRRQRRLRPPRSPPQ